MILLTITCRSDNFRFYIATLANNVANLVANANHVYVFKWYKEGRTPCACLVFTYLDYISADGNRKCAITYQK